MVDDIRVGPPEEFWDRLRTMLSPGGLTSYWYLGRAVNQLEDPATMRLRSDMRNGAGGIMAAPLSIAAPETGGWQDRDVVPAPVAYSLQIVDDALDVAEIRIHRSTVHQASRMGFSRSEIVDASDPSRLIAVTTGIGITLGPAPPGFRPIDMPPDLSETAGLPPLHTVFGVTRHADGWRLPPLDISSASTSASLHLGPIHVAFETAATEAAIEHSGDVGAQVQAWDVHFVHPGTVGPFLVDVTVQGGRRGRIATRMTIADEGNEGVLVASGTAVFRVSGGPTSSGS
jgi:hypothetical protein